MAALVVASPSASAQTVYAITTTDVLIRFDASNPAAVTTIGMITGAAGQSVGIDFRPATGQLYLVRSGTDRLYTLDLGTGAASQAASSPGLSVINSNAFVDFNPVTDRLHVVSPVAAPINSNVEVDPHTGVVVAQPEPAFAPGDPRSGSTVSPAGAAFSNSRWGVPPASTTLFLLENRGSSLLSSADSSFDRFHAIGPVTASVGSRGFDIYSDGGVDTLFAAGFSGSASQLYRINPATGQSTLVGAIGTTLQIRDIAVVPSPTGAALLGLACLTAGRRTRR